MVTSPSQTLRGHRNKREYLGTTLHEKRSTAKISLAIVILPFHCTVLSTSFPSTYAIRAKVPSQFPNESALGFFYEDLSSPKENKTKPTMYVKRTGEITWREHFIGLMVCALL